MAPRFSGPRPACGWRQWLATLLLLCLIAPVRAAETAEIERCMRANVPAALQIREFSLTAIDKAGAQRTLKGRLFVQREDDRLRTMMKVEGPADLRGAAYLLREGAPGEQDSMYVYLPALNKTRRITGGSQDNPLFGTDLSYADIKQMHNAFVGGAVRLLRSEPYEERPAYVLELVPDPARQSPFTRVLSWVDQRTCVAVRADFLSGEQVRKRYTATAKDLRQTGSYWYAGTATMEDIAAGTRTRVQLSGVKDLAELSANYFSPQSFHLGN